MSRSKETDSILAPVQSPTTQQTANISLQKFITCLIRALKLINGILYLSRAELDPELVSTMTFLSTMPGLAFIRGRKN